MNDILVTGLCTLHWGRLQYGNIGNYYIVEPLFRLLHKEFPNRHIVTTFQMDDDFIKKEDIEVLPMDIYYSWDEENDLNKALQDVEVAQKLSQDLYTTKTNYIKAIENCSLVINVSGDMWGDNAEHVGPNRFEVDCLKMKAAQMLGKTTILYAVTPGPFSDRKTRGLAKEIFEKFDLVVIREKKSETNLIKWGFRTNNIKWAPCPSFLFEPNDNYSSKWTAYINNAKQTGECVIGITFGGFNMPVGPYDMWPREDYQYNNFTKLAEYILNELNAYLVIFSHTNGFNLPPNFKLINGRDFTILNRFYDLLCEKNPSYKSRIMLIDEPLLPKNIKKVIGEMDMLITGRVHASVAAISQCIPTVFIEYDRNVVYSDKMMGFSAQVGMEKYVIEPQSERICDIVKDCFENLTYIQHELAINIPIIKKKATDIFGIISEIEEEHGLNEV